MSEDPVAPAAPDQRLRTLDPLVGRWTIAGDAEGETVYEWMDGRFFLMQRGHLARGGPTRSFVEIIASSAVSGRPKRHPTSPPVSTPPPATRSTTPTKRTTRR